MASRNAWFIRFTVTRESYVLVPSSSPLTLADADERTPQQEGPTPLWQKWASGYTMRMRNKNTLEVCVSSLFLGHAYTLEVLHK